VTGITACFRHIKREQLKLKI